MKKSFVNRFIDAVDVGSQYFYFDKYQTSISWTVLLNGSFMVLMSFLAIKKIVEFIRTREWSLNYKDIPVLVLYSFPVWILFVHLCRLGGAVYQMVTKEVRNGCLEYVNGTLVKTPFGPGYYRELGSSS